MKLSGKEILVIFVLAVLATGLSRLIETGCPKIDCPPGELCPFYFCITNGGFPLPYWNPAGKNLLEGAFLFILIDFIFYFFLLWLVWTGLKYVIKKVRKQI